MRFEVLSQELQICRGNFLDFYFMFCLWLLLHETVLDKIECVHKNVQEKER